MSGINVQEIISTFQRVIPETLEKNIGLHEPTFSGNEWDFVKECIDTRWVSSAGKYVDRFEVELADYVGVKHAIVTSNGTVALHLSLLLAGVKPMDEVLVPALTFVATCNAISYCGAIPHFVDSHYQTLGVDPTALRAYLEEVAELSGNGCINKFTKRPIRALCIMHTFGHPVHLDELAELANDFGLILIEDAAEALGSFYKNTHVGAKGLFATLSFNGNKIITTGGGGAILTNHSELAQQAKHLATTAKLPHAWSYQHDQVGYNYRLPNLNAALGCAQLEQLDAFLEAKRTLAKRYQESFSTIEGVSIFAEAEFAKSNYWLNVLILDRKYAAQRDILLSELNKNKVAARPVWTLMNELPMYQSCPSMDLIVAKDLESRLINIPSSVFLA